MKISDLDRKFLVHVIGLAQEAFEKDEVPIGAVVVDAQNNIIGEGFNKVESTHQASQHAEVIAINRASSYLQDWRLVGCRLYVSLEPCLMCLGLVQISRLEKVIYVASSYFLPLQLDNQLDHSLYKRNVIKADDTELEQISVALLKQFFKKKRMK